MRYRLMSMMPSAKDWGCRNDTYHHSYERPEQALTQARRELMQWQSIEPDTRFKIEQQDPKTHEWGDLPRNSHGGMY
jgi:hypothetical protein